MPIIAKLTDKWCRTARTEKSQEEFWDESRPGLYVRVGTSGVTFFYRYFVPGSEPCRERQRRSMRLGKYDPECPEPNLRYSLADAVSAWRSASGQVAQGCDPQGPSLRVERSGPEVVPLLVNVPRESHERVQEIFGKEDLIAGSFGELALDYLLQHAWAVKRRTRDDEQMLRRDLLPVWRNRPSRDISRADVVTLAGDIVKLRKAKVSANHVRLLISRIYNWGITQVRVEHNPAHLVRISGGKAKPGRRNLSDSEIRAVWYGLEKYGSVFTALIRTRIVLFQRPGEVSAMEWNEIQADGWWILPGEKRILLAGEEVEVGTKNKLPHTVFIPPLARGEIEAIRELTGASRFVFESPKLPGQPLWWTGKMLATLARDLGIPHFRPQDLRRTGTTNMQRLGYDHLVDPLVNHQPVGVRASYNLWAYREERKAAMLAWDAHLRSILGVERNLLLDPSINGLSSPESFSMKDGAAGKSSRLDGSSDPARRHADSSSNLVDVQ
jgi:integrase